MLFGPYVGHFFLWWVDLVRPNQLIFLSITCIFYIEKSTANSSGTLKASLHNDKSVAIEWSVPLVGCENFVSGLWIRVFESGEDAQPTSFQNIPKKCLTKTASNQSDQSTVFSIVLPLTSTVDECNFPLQNLIDCRFYQIEVAPDYQSLRGRILNTEIIIPPKVSRCNICKVYWHPYLRYLQHTFSFFQLLRESVGVLQSLINVSATPDSLVLNWEDNTGCASWLTSVNLRLWSDGVVPTSDNDNTLVPVNNLHIPRSCLKLNNDGKNLFSITLSANEDCPVQWISLDKCRKYKLEMKSQYSSKWTGPKVFQEFFTAITQQGL